MSDVLSTEVHHDSKGAIVPAQQFATPLDWLVANRLDKWNDAFEAIGTYAVCDFAEVIEEDLNAMGMPALQKRRFLTAAAKVEAPKQIVRAEETVKELRARVDKLALLPTEGSDTSYDVVALSHAAEAVAHAASTMQNKALDPKQWLEDFRLELFAVNFEGIGVQDIVDFTEVLDQDLMAMAMPIIQRRRFREHAVEIPPAGGASHRIDIYASQRATAADPAFAAEEWLRTLRLLDFQRSLAALGVRELADFREVREDDLVAMDMALIQRRRFLMSAAVVLPDLPESPEACIAAMQQASVVTSTPAAWLAALRVEAWAPTFEALGAVDLADLKEVLRADLDDMALPLLQVRRFLAAVTVVPDAPDLPGRRWEQPPRWLESLRLARFEPAFGQLGVDMVVDFGEVLESDLLEMGMSPLQRRRFFAAVAVDAQPTLEGEVVDGGPNDIPKGSIATLSSSEVLGLTPAQWLKLIRCESWQPMFADMGIESVLDFAEVCESDMLSMGLPALQRRRFTAAAVQVEELRLFQQEREVAQEAAGPSEAAGGEGAAPSPTLSFLTQLRLQVFHAAFVELGVDSVEDFSEVLAEDLVEMGMQALQRRRFLDAAAPRD